MPISLLMAAASRSWPVAAFLIGFALTRVAGLAARRNEREHPVATPRCRDNDSSLAHLPDPGTLFDGLDDILRASTTKQTKDVLVRVLAERTPGLDAHGDGVGELAEATARQLGLHVHEVELIRLAAELHDVGKSAIPDSILNKPGPLDDVEWDSMRRHTLIGERIVLAAPALAPVAQLVRWSHERFDGLGYPDGLAGEQIPLGARILSVCDAFDAMVNDRPYRRGMPAHEAIAELRRCSGSQFDPAVVDAFCALASGIDDVMRAA